MGPTGPHIHMITNGSTNRGPQGIFGGSPICPDFFDVLEAQRRQRWSSDRRRSNAGRSAVVPALSALSVMLSVGLVVMGPLAGDIEPRYRCPYYMFRTPLSQTCATMKGGVGGHITDLELSKGAFGIHFIHHQDHTIKWGPMGHIGVWPYLGSSTMY